tara:strand:- start:112 stop:462 length:351 start_codon:yes stop_codon:yes gene_type:complete
MQLTLDLPKYKWKEILKYLTPHRDESEYVGMLCTAIEMTKEGMTLNQKIYTFLVSNGLPPHYLPARTVIAKQKGGPGLLKIIYVKLELSLTDVRDEYSKYIASNYKLTPLEVINEQ